MELDPLINEIRDLQNRQKVIVLWTGLFFSLLFLHMIIDPILHWGVN